MFKETVIVAMSCLVIGWSGSVFAAPKGDDFVPPGHRYENSSGSVSGSNKNVNRNTNVNQNVNRNTNVNQNVNRNTNVNLNSQEQRQSQSQYQAQSQGQSQSVSNTGNSYVSSNSNQSISPSQSVIIQGDQREYISTPDIEPYETPLIQGGKVGDVTNEMPRFESVKPLDKKKDVVVKVLKVYQGNIFSRIRLGEIEEEILSATSRIMNGECGVVSMEKVRYVVQYKDSSTSNGIGGGFGGNASDITSGGTAVGGTLSVLPGTHRSTHDPLYIIKFFLIK